MIAAQLIACLWASTTTAAPDQAQTLAEQRTKNLVITCTSQEDCALKWGRALAWVSQNSAYKLKLATDSIITTEGPIDEFGYRTKSSFVVNKVPLGGSVYRIDFESACLSSEGCVPSHEALVENFGAYVDPVASSVSIAAGQKGRLGVGVFPLDRSGLAALHVPSDHGLIVGAVNQGSAAAKAGIAKGDVLLSCNGKALHSADELISAVRAAPAAVSIHLLRGGREMDLNIPL